MGFSLWNLFKVSYKNKNLASATSGCWEHVFQRATLLVSILARNLSGLTEHILFFHFRAVRLALDQFRHDLESTALPGQVRAGRPEQRSIERLAKPTASASSGPVARRPISQGPCRRLQHHNNRVRVALGGHLSRQNACDRVWVQWPV